MTDSQYLWPQVETLIEQGMNYDAYWLVDDLLLSTEVQAEVTRLLEAGQEGSERQDPHFLQAIRLVAINAQENANPFLAERIDSMSSTTSEWVHDVAGEDM